MAEPTESAQQVRSCIMYRLIAMFLVDKYKQLSKFLPRIKQKCFIEHFGSSAIYMGFISYMHNSATCIYSCTYN